MQISNFFPSSIEHEGTRPFSNIMAPLTLFNEAPKRKSVALLTLKNAYLWLSWPSLMRGTRPFSNIMAPLTLFNEAPKCKSIALLTLKNAYLWLSWPSLMRGTRPFSNMWYFCEVTLCVTILWYFCVGLLVAGEFYMVPLAYDNGMVPR